MKKIRINGRTYIPENEIKEELRYLRKTVRETYFRYSEAERDIVRDAYNDVIRALFRDELRAAKDEDERKAIMEMSGDFCVCRRAENPQERKLDYFCAWDGKDKPIIGNYDESMSFAYESMAENVRDRLNALLPCADGWKVFNMSDWETERCKTLLKAIFAEDDESDGDESGAC